MTMKDDHATYANGLTLIRLRLALNNSRVRLFNTDFTRLEKAIVDAETTEAFADAIKAWAKLIEQALRG